MINLTNIAICGANGKMGKVIFDVIYNRDDCRVVAGIDLNTQQYSDFPIVAKPSDLAVKPDVIIDFSHPSTLNMLTEYCLTNGVPVVFATTGYSAEQIEQIKKTAQQIPVFFTFNMSLGINLLVELAKKATAVLGNQFDIEIVEKHHNQKIDSPSGTAIMLADSINQIINNRCQYIYDRHSQRKKRDKNEIGISSIRGGTIVGEHEVIFAGRDEVITLSHKAFSKEVFAVGSVNAALFIKDKNKGLYDMSQLV